MIIWSHDKSHDCRVATGHCNDAWEDRAIADVTMLLERVKRVEAVQIYDRDDLPTMIQRSHETACSWRVCQASPRAGLAMFSANTSFRTQY